MKLKNEWRLFLSRNDTGQMASDEICKKFVEISFSGELTEKLGNGNFFFKMSPEKHKEFDPKGCSYGMTFDGDIAYRVAIIQRGLPMEEANEKIKEQAMMPSGVPDEIRKWTLGIYKE